MTRTTVWTLLALVAVLAASPASACRGEFSEQYLIWYGLPDLAPDEVAIEIDIKDAVDRLENSGRPTAFKVKRVLVGAFEGDVISYRAGGSSCNRTMASGSSERLILVGRLEQSGGSAPILVPRYMPYAHPIRAEAARLAEEAKAGRN